MEAFDIVSFVLNGLSVLSCLVVLIIYICFKEIHSFPAELTIYLIISVSFYNITYFFPGNDTHSTICQIQGMMSLVFDLCSIVWIAIIGCITYLSLTNKATILKKTVMLRIIFFIVSIVPSVTFALVSYFLGAIQASSFDSYCWFKFSDEKNPHYNSSITMGISYYSITWVIIFFNIYFIISIILKIKSFQLENSKMLRYTLKLIRYPIIQLISYIPTTIVGLIEMINNDSQIIPFWLLYIQLVFESLCGFFYVIAFIYNKDVIRSIRKSVHWFKGNEQIDVANCELKLEDNDTVIDNYDDDSI